MKCKSYIRLLLTSVSIPRYRVGTMNVVNKSEGNDKYILYMLKIINILKCSLYIQNKNIRNCHKQ